MQVSIATRLYLGFGLMALLILASSAFLIYQEEHSAKDYQSLKQKQLTQMA